MSRTEAIADRGGVPLAEAAARLGLSVEATRKRAQRGTLPAYKLEEHWYVLLGEGGQEPAHSSRTPPPTVPDNGQDGGQDTVPDSGQDAIEADYRAGAPAVVVSPAVSAQLAAIRDEWLQPLVDRIAELERERGRLEAERDADAQAMEELRRRAEAAERECEEIRQRHDALRASAIFSGPPALPAATSEAEDHEHDLGDLRPLGRLQRLWRAIRGGQP